MAYASGKNAWGISDRSGRRYRLREMKVEWTGAKVGPDEFEPKHPQLYPPKAYPDPQHYGTLAQRRVLASNVQCSGAGTLWGLRIFQGLVLLTTWSLKAQLEQ